MVRRPLSRRPVAAMSTSRNLLISTVTAAEIAAAGLDLSNTPETWLCADCGVDTAPGNPTRFEAETALKQLGEVRFPIDDRCEVYTVRDHVWAKAGIEPLGGCLCVGCIERRLGRQLRPKDFQRDHPLNEVPGTPRLMQRRGDRR